MTEIAQIVLSRFLTVNNAAVYVETLATRTNFLLGTLRFVLSEERRKLKPGRTSPLVEDVEDSTRRIDEDVAIRDQINVAMSRLSPTQAHAIRARYGLAEPSEELLSLSDSARYSLTWRAKQALRVALSKLAVHET
jgi:DNA-directed RNA polymerase sigma subunit (sigma70/sigma32)